MDVHEQRVLKLFHTTNYFAFGKLWKVKNFLWRRAVPGFVSKNDQGMHPAVSLGKKNLASIYQTVPMLLGSHSNKKGFLIQGFSKRSRKDGFFKIKPYYLPAADAIGAHRGIEPNDFKSSLDPKEMAELKHYLTMKGVRYDD